MLWLGPIEFVHGEYPLLMTLRQLEYFIAVVEEGSFTRAAERLFVSQPALSHQIRVLELEFGCELLERLPRSVHMTERGVAFLPHAVATVRSAEDANRAALSVAALESGELRVGTLFSLALGVIPPAIRAWRAAHPHVRVDVLEFTSVGALAAGMLAGAADVALGPRPDSWRGPIRPLGIEEFVLVLPDHDPLLRTGDGTVSVAELAERPWVLYPSDSGLAPVVVEACAAAGFSPRGAAVTYHSVTAIELAAAGVGVALVPDNVVSREFAGCTARPDPPVRRELVAFARSRPSTSALAFIDVLDANARL
jgi:DNA-binding transcriptional LysR family regulator